MGTVERFIGGAFALIFLYLVVANASGANTVLRGLADSSSSVFRTLQGR